MPRRERTERHATLYTRGDLPRPAARRRDAVADELADIAASGAIDAFDVVQWAKRVPLTGTSARERALATAFRAWADDQGVDLAPCFETRQCYAQETGEKRTELVMPVLCLAVFEDDELVEVTPHARDDDVVTVADCMERLADERIESSRDERALTTAD